MSDFFKKTIFLGVSFWLFTLSLIASEWKSAFPEALQKKFPAQFVTALERGNDGEIWIATERQGLFRMKKENGEWTWKRVPAQKGFPETEHFYALCRDKFGRIWAGTDRRGVAVFDGKNWQTLNRRSGLPATRIFSLAASPRSGDVAVAHDCGISVCFGETGKWKHFTILDGLPTNQPSCVSFSVDGTLWAGFQCGGVASASSKNAYASWKKFAAPWSFGGKNNVLFPTSAAGAGLPSNFVNWVCAFGENNVACGTVSGLGFTNVNGAWEFLRGADFPKKAELLINGKPDKIELPDEKTKQKLLPEDFITCLKATKDGLWAGTRRRGLVLLDPENGFAPKIREGLDARQADGVWVRSVLPIGEETLLVASYGNGLKAIRGQSDGMPEILKNESEKAPAFDFSPSEETEVAVMRERLENAPELPSGKPWAVFLGEDWETRGNWCERYGQRSANLCAVFAPNEVCRYTFDHAYYVRGGIGKSAKPDALRHWVHWVNKMDNENILFEPESHMREEAEWDDHGEAYPFEQEGPDVWAYVKVPAGTQLVSLYFYCPNPEMPRSKYRDFPIEVRFQRDNNTDGEVLARARVSDFAGSGVYKNFAVSGGGVFAFRVCRNYSFNTILNGVFVSRLNEPVKDKDREGWTYRAYRGDDLIPRPASLDSLSEEDFPPAALELWRTATAHDGSRLGLQMRQFGRNLAYVRARQVAAPECLLENWGWHIGLELPGEREEFVRKMRAGWDKFQEVNRFANSENFYPYSPNVIPFTSDEIDQMAWAGIDWKQYRPGGKPEIPVEEMKKKIREIKAKKENKK